MTTQPLTKSDWDGHPCWWVRFDHDTETIDLMVLKITNLGVVTYSRFFDWKYLAQHCLRSHDRIHWQPCSREVNEPPQQLREGAWYSVDEHGLPKMEDYPVYVYDQNTGFNGYAVRMKLSPNGMHGEYSEPHLLNLDGTRTTVGSKRATHWKRAPRLEQQVPPPQPDTVDVEKLIEALSFRDASGDSVLHGLPDVGKSGIERTRRALAALHPRLKAEVESK